MLDALPLGYPLPLTYPETLVKYYVFLDGEYDLAVYNKRYEFLDGEYDLNAYLKQYTHLSGEYDLNAYTKKYQYLDGEYALLAYAKTYQYLDGEYDLNAYTKKYQYLDGEYALLAYEVFKAFVANLATGAHSTYSNFDFNSLSGSYGAKSDGIYRLTGTTDNGAVINTLLDIGKTDFQSSFLKRISDAYLGLASDGNIKMTVATENSSTEYVVTADSDLMTHKINLGRGALGRYWQVKLENQSGSSFVLEDIELYAEILSRRAQGNTVQTTVTNPTPAVNECCNDIEYTFSWGDATPQALVIVASGKTVFKVEVVMLSVFNGAVVDLTIGDSANHARLLASDQISLYDLATYETNPNYTYSVETAVNLYLTVDGSNTQGNGIIKIYLKD